MEGLCKHCGKFGDKVDGYCSNYCRLAAQDEINQVRQTLREIHTIASQLPPHYAYGDNQAAVRMSDQLDEIAKLADCQLAQM